MKRETEKVPGFDDVIFQDRNKEYGAYDLRKRYGSTMSVSIVAAMIFGISMVLIPFFTTDRNPGEIRIPVIRNNEPVSTYLPDPPEYTLPSTPKPPEKVSWSVPPVIVDGDVTPTEFIPLPEDFHVILNEQGTGITYIDQDVDQQVIPPEEKPHIFVAEMPEFPGGNSELLKFIYSNIIYPQDAIDNQIEGTVNLRFVVSRTGEVTEIEVLRSVNPMLDREAIRVLSMMPRWRPGKQEGIPVPVYFNVPVTFKIGGR